MGYFQSHQQVLLSLCENTPYLNSDLCNLEVCHLRCVKLIILQCIMCIYIHIHAVKTQQLTDGISM
jgi:hypothetical protein